MNANKLFIASVIFFTLTACSMYESGGRKAIETNENGVVGTFGTYGFTASLLTEYYACEREKTEPEFLKSALEVVETPYESKNITTLYNSKSNPPSVIVYAVDKNNTYSSCRISGILPSTENLSSNKIQQMASAAVEQIEKILPQTAPSARP